MTDREAFLEWIHGALIPAERALHNGDPGPRRALWSRNEPVSVLGAWRNANGQREADELFTSLGESFSNCTSFAIEVLAYDVIGDMAPPDLSTPPPPSMASLARTHCARLRCTDARTGSGRSPIDTATQ